MKTQHLKHAVAVTLLLLSWGVLFFLWMLLTELILVPWDTAIERPEVGTLARTVNDFFEAAPGAYILPTIVLALSLWLTFPALRRRLTTAYSFAAINFACVGLCIIFFTFSALINNNLLFPYPPVLYDPNYIGYHRSALPGLVALAVLMGWLLWQRRIRDANLRMA
ncbi:MAG: hypothetical protein U0694_18960 [Anaerolineae bacterium]